MDLRSALAYYMRRSDYRDLPELPVVIVEGLLRSGKSTALTHLDSLWRPRAPVVHLKMRGVPRDVPARTVAVTIADELLLRTPVPKGLFASLFLGVAALEPPLSENTERAVRELTAYLEGRDQVMQSVRATVGAARNVVMTIAPTDVVARGDAGLAAVAPVAWWVRQRRPAYRWFASATGATTGLKGLVLLNRWHQRSVYGVGEEAVALGKKLDEVLLRAFLADLRRGFTRWRNSGQLTHHVLLLVDDVDASSNEGHARLRFVEELLIARQQRKNELARDDGVTERPDQKEHRSPGDPLMVVASCGTQLRVGVPRFPFTRDVIGPVGLAEVDLGRRDGADNRLMQPICVVDIAVNLPALPGLPDAVARWCRSISCGHRWAFEQLTANAGVLPQPHLLHLETLLPSTLSSEFIDAALDGETIELRRYLQILAAVDPLDPDPAAAFAAVIVAASRGRISPAGALDRHTQAVEFVSRKLWAEARSTALHPFVRLVLLAELSAAEPPWSWSEVFTQLAGRHGDQSLWYYHYLLAARGDAVSVAEQDEVSIAGYLSARLQHEDAADSWLKDLDLVVTAPRRRDHAASADVGERLQSASGGGGTREAIRTDEQRVAEIVGALWLSHNHMGARDLDEYEWVAHALQQLADGTTKWNLTRSLHGRAVEYRAHRRRLTELD